MHGLEEFSNSKNSHDLDARPWYAEMTRYHWFVLMIAALGWLFDCLDQQLFTLARVPAMKELLGLPQEHPSVKAWGGFTTTIFMLGWATGGLYFGVLGDRIGRAKTMMLTILLYSACTGLSAFSFTVWDFSFYRFLTGLGVGGEFAVGVALVAEVMPERARARTLSLLQALSAVGNVSAALIGMGLAPYEESGISTWRVMFVIGALPALLAVVIRRNLKEPERWQAVSSDSKAERKLGSYSELFRHPTWRRNAVLGLCLAVPGVIGLWGIGFFSTDLSRSVFRQEFGPKVYDEFIAAAKEGNDASRVALLTQLREYEIDKSKLPQKLDEEQTEVKKEVDRKISSQLSYWAGVVLLMQQVGAFCGMYSFGWLAQRVGRKPTFFAAYFCAMLSTVLVFWFLDKPRDVFWMIPVMGFFQLSLFAGYAIYFPELFPTYLRSTGISFCYNVGRFVAAFGPSLFGLLTSQVFAGPGYPEPMPWRYAGVSMSAIFIVGMITLIFAPETKGKPLPE